MQASLTYFALRYLGYDATLYDGSFVSGTKETIMRTRLIPSSDWRGTLDDLSRSFSGALVSLEVVGGEIGAEEEVRDQPLRGLTSDCSGVSVQIETAGGVHLDHRIAHPQKIRIVETNESTLTAAVCRTSHHYSSAQCCTR